jgi:hypothetical protein
MNDRFYELGGNVIGMLAVVGFLTVIVGVCKLVCWLISHVRFA